MKVFKIEKKVEDEFFLDAHMLYFEHKKLITFFYK